ncbi:MAG: EpsG family protein [Clostridiales bacterium]|nr:EpsG family protein [Clostridiales bacterium]
MNLYLIVFLILAAAVLLEWFKPQYEEKIYGCCWILMTACLCFRFGQGTDYATYHAIYETIPPVIDLSQGYLCGFYPETGWRLISALFKVFHAPFWVFTMVLGLAEMMLLHRFLRKYVPMKAAGLLLCYPVLFITYMVSGLRQGLAMCLFLGVAVPFYLEKKWGRYVISILIAASFHRVGYAWLVLPVVYYLPVQIMMLLTGLSVAGGLLLQVGPVEQFLVNLVPAYHVKQFLLEGEVSLFAVGERLTAFLVLLGLYLWKKKKDGTVEEKTELLLKAYMCGVCFYMLLCGSSYYASRYGVIFKVLECVLVVLLVRERDRAAKTAAAFFFGVVLLMGFKNMNAMILEGGYASFGIKVWNYPYISVFRQDAIDQFFPYEEKVKEIYGYNIEDQQLWMIER